MAIGTDYYREKIYKSLKNTNTRKLQRICRLFNINYKNKSDEDMRNAIADKVMKQDTTGRVVFKLVIDIMR